MGKHRWTDFELQTMLALMVKNVHVSGRPEAVDVEKYAPLGAKAKAQHKKTYKDPFQHHTLARLDFATMFNEAINGKESYNHDIAAEEIWDKLDELLIEKKHLFGKDQLAHRSKALHLTRSLTMAFRRTHAMDYDGSMEEWEKTRKKKVSNNVHGEYGLTVLPDSADILEAEKAAETRVKPMTPVKYRKYNKYKDVDPGLARHALPVARVSKVSAPIDYNSDSADEGEIRETEYSTP